MVHDGSIPQLGRLADHARKVPCFIELQKIAPREAYKKKESLKVESSRETSLHTK